MRAETDFTSIIKRAIDIVGATLLLALLAPLLLFIALLVRATSRGPALFAQERVGYRRRAFTMLKFRTMEHECDDQLHREFVTGMLVSGARASKSGNVIHKLADDPRVTGLGRFLRRSSLDELPQLFNIVRGHMSLVGPRPILAWEAELLDAEYDARFAVKPGLTGLWQVEGRNRLTMNDALELDVEYARRHSLLLDLRILVLTIPTVLWSALSGRGAR
jgi:lipopolysaccharide/colanic/teichoic acid biosynthesis glycosyltransferase